MNRLKRSYKFFLLICSIAALWISIGSLVHFHQYKIYGHRLLSEVVISKRENEVPGPSGSDLHISSDGIIPCESSPDLVPALTRGTTLPVKFIPVSNLYTGISLSLRAPPAC